MKRTLVSLFSLMGLALAVTSCQKDEGVAQFNAAMEPCTYQDGKTILNGEGVEWAAGDRIAVYGSAGCAIYEAQPQTPATTATFTLVSGNAGNAPYSAMYPAEIAVSSNSVELPAVQNSVDGALTLFPMYATSSTENLNFKNLCGALKITLQKNGVNVSRIDVTTNEFVNGVFTVAMNGDAPTMTYASNGSHTSSLVCSTAQDISNGHEFYLYMPHNTYTSLTLVITAEDGSVCTLNTNSSFMGLNIHRSEVTEINLNANSLNFVPAEEGDAPAGAINGLFSISSTKQVYFSKGNLQYLADGSWKFADHQYDIVGEGNANPAQSSIIDLFGWGASGFDGKAPYMTSTVNSDYGFGYNRSINNTEYDWGYYNAIANGGNEAGLWTLINVTEMRYLYQGRANAAELRGVGSVNGVPGVILLPDNWTLPAGLNFTPGTSGLTGGTGYTRNTYSIAEWTRMEAAGAVFLPAAGRRFGEVVDKVEIGGWYWLNTSNSTNNAAAHYFDFQNNRVISTNQYAKHQGASVRLVRVAE